MTTDLAEVSLDEGELGLVFCEPGPVLGLLVLLAQDGGQRARRESVRRFLCK